MADFKALVHKGFPPNHCACDSTWRRLPNGEQAVFFLTGAGHEPEPGNFVALCRSADEGVSWSAFETILTNPNGAATLSEVVVHDGVISVYVQIHAGRFDHWETAVIRSSDNGYTWTAPESFAPLPRRSMIRNLYRTQSGSWILPYQYYEPTGNWEASVFDDGSMNHVWNGTLLADSPDGPWRPGGTLQGSRGWAEVNVVELRDGRLVMLARCDGRPNGEGCLLRTESTDGGRSWSAYRRSGIPNPGSKFRLFRLSDDRIVLLHNPTPATSHPNGKCAHRNPLGVWISDDDMETWGDQRILADFPGMLAYPDGEVDADERLLHFAFDYNRHDVIYWRVEIPPA